MHVSPVLLDDYAENDRYAASFCQQMFSKDCKLHWPDKIAIKKFWRQTDQELALTIVKKKMELA